MEEVCGMRSDTLSLSSALELAAVEEVCGMNSDNLILSSDIRF